MGFAATMGAKASSGVAFPLAVGELTMGPIVRGLAGRFQAAWIRRGLVHIEGARRC